MENIPTKNTGDSYTASEFNESNDELKNSITDGGQTLTSADDFQISKSMAINAAGATFYVDSGVADAYVLSKAGTVSLRSPTAYFEGMIIRFRPDNNNTGATTVNVTALGVKSILKADKVTALSPGDISTGIDALARFDLGVDAFLLFPGAIAATKTTQGLAFLGDQQIILSNNTVDPDNDLDFSGGRFTFDDGTGDMIVGALTKQLDASFVVGNNQGGLDTGVVAGLSTYHCFAIFNPTTGVADYLFSLSVASPTLPSGFTKKRRVGSILTQGAPNNKEILPFIQVEKYFYLSPPIGADLDITNPGTAAASRTLTVPVGIEVLTMTRFNLSTSSASNIFGLIYSPDITEPGTPAFNFNNLHAIGAGLTSSFSGLDAPIKTNTSAQVNSKFNLSGTGVFFRATTFGWIDITLEN